MNSTPKTYAIVALTALALAGGAAWLLLQGSDDRASASANPTPQGFGSVQLETFSVLRGPTAPIPGPLQESLRSYSNPEIRNLWMNTAKYVRTDGGGVWVVNGSGVSCIIQATRGSVACIRAAEFLRKGVILGIFPPPRHRGEPPHTFIAWGIAPDWADAVRLKVGNRTRSIAIHGNAYSLRARAPIVLDRLLR